MSDINLDEKMVMIYSGVEGSKDYYANTVECLQTEHTMLLRFFNQRPLLRAPIKLKIEGGNAQVLIGDSDTIERALQTSVVLPVEAARLLKDMLANLLSSYDEGNK